MLQVFDEDTFFSALDKCYSDPLTVKPTWLCQLYLVLAIGLCLTTPKAGSREAQVIDSVRMKRPDQSEVFYFTAKSLSDPFVGFDNASLWSIQALALMALYMLLRTRRNTAFAYTGTLIHPIHQ